MELTHVLQAPVVTEKSTGAQAGGRYTFLVHSRANKVQIAQAVKEAYGVQVKTVRIIPVLKKVRLIGRGRVMTKRPAAKKAVVTLAGKGTIDVNKFRK